MPQLHDRDHLPAIVCLDSSGAIWRRLRELVEDESLSSQFILTRVSDSSADLIALCRRLIPALLVVDEERLGALPFAALNGMAGPGGIQVLLIAETTSHSSLEGFFRQGCAGVLSGRVSDDVLLNAVRSVLAGELWLPRKLISGLAREGFSRGSATAKLTRREGDILRLISQGHTNQEIADKCFISRETVRWHIRSLYTKIGVDDRKGAIREAKLFYEVSPSLSAAD